MQTIIVDTTPGFRMPTINYSQGDIGRTFAIDLRSRFGDSLPASPTITIQATKPSGLGFSVASTSISGAVVTFTVTETMSNEAGRFPAELKIVKSGTTLFTANFYIECEASAHPEGTTDGDLDSISPKFMSVTTTTLPAGDSATYSYDPETNTATFGIPKGADGSLASQVLAADYSSSKTYAVGDYVYYNGNLYKCSTAITTAEAWTSGHWAQVALGDDVSDLKSDINDYVGKHTANLYDKNSDLIGKGITSSGEIIDNENYKLSDLIYIGANKTFTFETKSNASLGTGVTNIAYYDENKDFSARVAVASDETVTFTTNQYRHYIRLVMLVDTPDLMCNMGDSILPYAPYGIEYCDYLKGLAYENSKTYGFEMGGITVYGDLVENNIRVRSLPVYFPNNIGNSKLTFMCNSEYVFALMVFFDENGNFTRSVNSFSYVANEKTEVQINDGENSFIIAFKKANNAEFTEQEVASLNVTCYFRDVASFEEVDAIRQKVNALQSGNWHGKKYVALGDSITYGFIPRNYTGYPGQLDSYAKLTAEALGMTFDNQGITGSTMAYVEGRSAMSRRYDSLSDDADLITVMGGTNDIRNGVQLGTMDDRDDSTYYGALHVVLGGLYKKYFIDQGTTVGKTKKIVVLTPLKLLEASSAYNPSGEGTLVNLEPWVEAVKKVSAFYGFPCLDFYNLSGINPHINRTIHGTDDGYTGYYNPYITDGTHPTQEGANMMANVLTKFLESLI